MSSSSQRLILFDVDQTLLSTRGGDRKALNTAFSELYGIEDAFKGVGFGGRMDLSIMAEVYRINNVPDGDRNMDEFKTIYFERLAQVLPVWDNGIVYPGVRELLRALESEEGVQLGLATGNFREAAFIKLQRYGLDGYFVEGGFGGDHPERPEVVADAIVKCQEIAGKVYELLQFHFHAPAEHAFAGMRAAMEVHFVHRSASGALAVAGLTMRVGGRNEALAAVFANMPAEAGPAVGIAGATVDASAVLPRRAGASFQYGGSLTTPPCSEGVRWIVLAEPIEASAEQVAAFRRIVGPNARPLQALRGRLPKLSR